MTGPTLPGECIASIRLIPSPVPTATSLPIFLENQPYIESDPSTVRDDFWLVSQDCPDYALAALTRWLPTDTLADFMDELAMGRV
jgi:hypothetical protein